MTVGLSQSAVSGELSFGYRVLSINDDSDLNFSVYRGDYIKFQVSKTGANIPVHFPELEISDIISGKPDDDPYFKMKKSGKFAFSVDGKTGVMHVLDYVEASYTELSASESYEFITDRSPLILDVRTFREFQSGHLQGAKLIPVQELQNRLHELESDKENDIVVYCRSGNRSTVASKILIDAEFKRIYNVRSGIIGWNRASLPIEK